MAARWAPILRAWCAHLCHCTRIKLEADPRSTCDADASLLRISMLCMTADALLTCREALELLAVVARVDMRGWHELLEFYCGCDGLGKALSVLSPDGVAHSLPRLRVEFVSHRPYGERLLDTTGHQRLFLPATPSSAEFRAALQQLYACMTSTMRAALAASRTATWRTTLRFVMQDYVYADTTTYLNSVRSVIRAIAMRAALFRVHSAPADLSSSSVTDTAALSPVPPLDPIASAFLFELERGEVSLVSASTDATAAPVIRDLAAMGVQFTPDESVCDSNARIPLACLGPIVLERTDTRDRGFSRDSASPTPRVFPAQTHALTIRSRFVAPKARVPRFQAIVSALASAKSIRSVTFDSLDASQSAGARVQHWRWLSYMLLSKEARSSVEALTLTERAFGVRDVQAIMSVLTAKHPAHLLMDRESLVEFFSSSRTRPSDLARSLGLDLNSSSNARLYELLTQYASHGSRPYSAAAAASLIGLSGPLRSSSSSSVRGLTGVGAEFAALFTPNSAARQFHQRPSAPLPRTAVSARGGRGRGRTTAAAAQRNPQPQPVRSSYLVPPPPLDTRANAYYPLNGTGRDHISLPTSLTLGRLQQLVVPPIPYPMPGLSTVQRGGRGGGRTGGRIGAGGRGGRGTVAPVPIPVPAPVAAPRAPTHAPPPPVTDTDLGSVLLPKGAIVFANPFDVETETPEPVVLHQAALFSIIRDDSRCQWIDIVVPGYGYCAVPRALVNHVELTLDDDDDDDDAVKSSVDRGYSGAITSLTLSITTIDATPNLLLPLLQYLGPRLETLMLDCDLPANPEELSRILDVCPRLRKLRIRAPPIPSRVFATLTRAYATGRCRVDDLEIASCPSDAHVVQFIETLKDSNSVAAQTLKRLVLICSRTLSIDVLTVIAQMLQVNTTLATIELNVASTLPRATWLSLISTDGKRLPGTKAPLPLASRLAFLSVVRRLRSDVEPLQKRHRSNANSTSDSARGRRWAADLDRLDTDVIALIFAFGAEPTVRHLRLQTDDLYIHADAYFDDEDEDDDGEGGHSGEDDYLSDMSGETNES